MARREVAWDTAIEVAAIVLDDYATLSIRKVGDEVDVRKHVSSNRYTGPTKAGFLLNREQAGQLWAALGKALHNGEAKPKANGRARKARA
jgi:hypothetical protein